MRKGYSPKPIDGYVCVKCRSTQGCVTPSSMAVICPNCPWEAMIPNEPKDYEQNGTPKQFNDLKDYQYQLLILFKKLLATGPKTPDELFEWSSRQYRFEHPVASYRFQAAASDPAVNRLCTLAFLELEYLEMHDGKITLPQPRTLDAPWRA